MLAPEERTEELIDFFDLSPTYHERLPGDYKKIDPEIRKIMLDFLDEKYELFEPKRETSLALLEALSAAELTVPPGRIMEYINSYAIIFRFLKASEKEKPGILQVVKGREWENRVLQAFIRDGLTDWQKVERKMAGESVAPKPKKKESIPKAASTLPPSSSSLILLQERFSPPEQSDESEETDDIIPEEKLPTEINLLQQELREMREKLSGLEKKLRGSERKSRSLQGKLDDFRNQIILSQDNQPKKRKEKVDPIKNLLEYSGSLPFSVTFQKEFLEFLGTLPRNQQSQMIKKIILLLKTGKDNCPYEIKFIPAGYRRLTPLGSFHAKPLGKFRFTFQVEGDGFVFYEMFYRKDGHYQSVGE